MFIPPYEQFNAAAEYQAQNAMKEVAAVASAQDLNEGNTQPGLAGRGDIVTISDTTRAILRKEMDQQDANKHSLEHKNPQSLWNEKKSTNIFSSSSDAALADEDSTLKNLQSMLETAQERLKDAQEQLAVAQQKIELAEDEAAKELAQSEASMAQENVLRIQTEILDINSRIQEEIQSSAE